MSEAHAPDRQATGRRHLDAEVAARLRDRDAAAYTTVFRAYYLPVVRFLTQYLDSTDSAEDVAQDVLLQLWERRAEVNPTRSLKA